MNTNSNPVPVDPAEALARRFHEAYERLAPSFGYATRKESAVPWDSVPAQNKALMIAVCRELLAQGVTPANLTPRPIVTLETVEACFAQTAAAFAKQNTDPNAVRHIRETLRIHRFNVFAWLLESGAQIPQALLHDEAHPAVGKQRVDALPV